MRIKNWADCEIASEKTGILAKKIAKAYNIENLEMSSLENLLEISLSKKDIPNLFKISKNKLSTDNMKMSALKAIFKHSEKNGHIRLMKRVHDNSVYPLKLKEKIYHASEKELNLRLTQAKVNPTFERLWRLHSLTFHMSQVEDDILIEIVNLALEQKNRFELWRVYSSLNDSFHSDIKEISLDAILKLAIEKGWISQAIRVYWESCVIEKVNKKSIAEIEKWSKEKLELAEKTNDLKWAKRIRETLRKVGDIQNCSKETINSICASGIKRARKKPSFKKWWELHEGALYGTEVREAITEEILDFAVKRKSFKQLREVKGRGTSSLILIRRASDEILKLAIKRNNFKQAWYCLGGFGDVDIRVLNKILDMAINKNNAVYIKKVYEYKNNNNPKSEVKILRVRALKEIVKSI